MQIAFLFFDQLTLLDAVGPIEVLARLPGAQVRTVARRAGPITTDVGLGLVSQHSFSEVTAPEIVVVPGGPGSRRVSADPETLEWVRSVHEHTRFTTSVCTGALILGAAGLLRGLRATTYWSEVHRLEEFGATFEDRRFVEDGKVITSAGVSAGIDMALHLARRVAGDTVAQALQLAIQYDPDPPFDTGSPSKAGPQLVERVRAAARRALGETSGS